MLILFLLKEQYILKELLHTLRRQQNTDPHDGYYYLYIHTYYKIDDFQSSFGKRKVQSSTTPAVWAYFSLYANIIMLYHNLYSTSIRVYV